MYQAYYAYSNVLRAQGAQFSIPTTNVYDTANCGVMISRYEIAAPQPSAGSKIGEVKCTWFVKLSIRKFAV